MVVQVAGQVAVVRELTFSGQWPIAAMRVGVLWGQAVDWLYGRFRDSSAHLKVGPYYCSCGATK